MRRILMFTVLGIMSLVCSGEERLVQSGKIVWAGPQTIHEFDVVSGQQRNLSEKFRGGVESVSKIDEHRLLVGVSGNVDGIVEFDRDTGAVRWLRRGGQWPVYIPEHKTFFFFDTRSYDEGTRLYLANLDDPERSAKQVVRELGKFGPYPRLVQVSRDDVVFTVTDEPGKQLHLFNLATGKLRLIPTKDQCVPEMWRTATRQVLCFKHPDRHGQRGQYYLISLDGQRVEPVDALVGHQPIAYLPRFDVALFYREAIPKQFIMAYSFRTKRTVIVTEGSAGWSGAAWFEK